MNVHTCHYFLDRLWDKHWELKIVSGVITLIAQTAHWKKLFRWVRALNSKLTTQWKLNSNIIYCGTGWGWKARQVYYEAKLPIQLLILLITHWIIPLMKQFVWTLSLNKLLRFPVNEIISSVINHTYLWLHVSYWVISHQEVVLHITETAN